MGRFALFVFNLLFGLAAAMAVGFLLKRPELNVVSIRETFLQFGIEGLLVGATVGTGAVLGPRPALSLVRCALAQALVALSSAVGGFIGSLFPEAVDAAGHAVRQAFARRGVVLGSWVGAAAGTVLEIIHVYRMRRKKEDPPK